MSEALTPSKVNSHVENRKMTGPTMILDVVDVNDAALCKISKRHKGIANLIYIDLFLIAAVNRSSTHIG